MMRRRTLLLVAALGGVMAWPAAHADGLSALENFLRQTQQGKAAFTQTVTSPPRQGESVPRVRTSRGVFEFQPRKLKLGLWVQQGFANPWGLAFDRCDVAVVTNLGVGALFHDVGMAIHRDRHEDWSLFLAEPKARELVDAAYSLGGAERRRKTSTGMTTRSRIRTRAPSSACGSTSKRTPHS